ncbi:hypothetical protein T08_8288 [Trichinella sp. T8]|nr:hypothetical protein T08_8288 [Trichinella sp. T8]
MAICIIIAQEKSTNKYTNIPCLSKTAANSSNSLSIKGKLQNVMGYRLVILAKMAKKLLSRELCDRETRGYVFCTPLLIVVWRFSTEPPQYFWSKRALKFTFCQF